MSRKKTAPKKKVTAPVTDTRPADVFARVPDFGAMLGLEPLGPEKEPTPKELKAEQAAYELLVQSPRYKVGTVGEANHALRTERISGRLEGMIKGRMMPRTEAEAHARSLRPVISNVLQEVFDELQKAYAKFGKQQASPHEGYAVLQEEVDELWDEIKADRGRLPTARKEAVQAAAMAVRYIVDNMPR
jgi:NTP pyrophosphatase (non-canonical NTP hydrolase)